MMPDTAGRCRRNVCLNKVLEGWQGKKCRPRAVLFSLTGPQINSIRHYIAALPMVMVNSSYSRNHLHRYKFPRHYFDNKYQNYCRTQEKNNYQELHMLP